MSQYTLKTLQQDFLNAVTKQSLAQQFSQHIRPKHGLSPEQRVAIYRNNSEFALSNMLAEIYPVCTKLVGKRFFDAMAKKFIARHVSDSPNLHDYGRKLSTFIARFPPAASLPYLPDMARLEWIWHRVYLSANSAPLDVTALANVHERDHANLRFTLPTGATLFHSPYPIHRIWTVNQDNYQGNPTVTLDEGEDHLIVWRRELKTRIDKLTQETFSLLEKFDQGVKLGDMDENIVASTLSQFVEYGWIGGFRIDGTD